LEEGIFDNNQLNEIEKEIPTISKKMGELCGWSLLSKKKTKACVQMQRAEQMHHPHPSHPLQRFITTHTRCLASVFLNCLMKP
jgi:hypothetical protein